MKKYGYIIAASIFVLILFGAPVWTVIHIQNNMAEMPQGTTCVYEPTGEIVRVINSGGSKYVEVRFPDRAEVYVKRKDLK